MSSSIHAFILLSLPLAKLKLRSDTWSNSEEDSMYNCKIMLSADIFSILSILVGADVYCQVFFVLDNVLFGSDYNEQKNFGLTNYCCSHVQITTDLLYVLPDLRARCCADVYNEYTTS